MLTSMTTTKRSHYLHKTNYKALHTKNKVRGVELISLSVTINQRVTINGLHFVFAIITRLHQRRAPARSLLREIQLRECQLVAPSTRYAKQQTDVQQQ